MKFGFVLPYGNARAAAEIAQLAERSGWDGFFVWEPVWGIDAWVCLTAAAMGTERIRLGTMLTPLSRLRPWQFAGQAATLDQLSGGRVVVSVGLGAVDTGFTQFGEETDVRRRAELLDEGLAIVDGLWRGQPFAFAGKHYRVEPCDFQVPPPPTQTPRIPIWVVGLLSSRKSMRRALAWDGLLPSVRDASGGYRPLVPDDIATLAPKIAERRAAHPNFDVVVEGRTPANDAAAARAVVQPWRSAGATWWIESHWGTPRDLNGHADVRARVAAGPPA